MLDAILPEAIRRYSYRSRHLGSLLLTITLLFSLLLTGCSSVGNLRVYRDANGAYSFAYPNGMLPVDRGSPQGPAVLLRDLVDDTENVNLMIAPFDRADTLQSLGSPREVGSRVADKMIAPPGSGRTAHLLNAGQLERAGKTYYVLEYAIEIGSQHRHDVVALTINRHQLYTLTASTEESRWPQVKDNFYAVAQSLQVG